MLSQQIPSASQLSAEHQKQQRKKGSGATVIKQVASNKGSNGAAESKSLEEEQEDSKMGELLEEKQQSRSGSKALKLAISASIATSLDSVYHRSYLSIRAEQVRADLCKAGEVVAALLVNEDGIISGVKYDTSASAKHAHKLLGGRPSVVGEIEGLSAIVLRSLEAGTDISSGKNAHELPWPFEKHSFAGKYLIYKLGKQAGKYESLSADEYSAYCKQVQAKSKKRASEERPLIAGSSHQMSGWAEFRSGVEYKVRQAFAKQLKCKASEEEVRNSTETTVQAFVEAWLKEGENPMADPDYKLPEQEMKEAQAQAEKESEAKELELELAGEVRDQLEEALVGIRELAHRDRQKLVKSIRAKHGNQGSIESELASAFDVVRDSLFEDGESQKAVSESQYRAKMESALVHVSRVAVADGEKLAHLMADTYCEVNGAEPSLKQLSGLFAKVKAQLAQEATQDELVSEEEEAAEAEVEAEEQESYAEEEEEQIEQEEQSVQVVVQSNNSAFAFRQSLGGLEEAGAFNLMKYAYKLVKEDLQSRTRSMFHSTNGRNPSHLELKENIMLLAKDTLLQSPSLPSSLSESRHALQVRGRRLQLASVEEEEEDTSTTEEELEEEKELELEALEALEEEERKSEQESEYNPNNKTDRKIALRDEIEEENYELELEEQSSTLMLKSPTKKSKHGSKSYSLYFPKASDLRGFCGNANQRFKSAIASFESFNKRPPTTLEMKHLSAFLMVESKLVIEGKAKLQEKRELDLQLQQRASKQKLAHACSLGKKIPVYTSAVQKKKNSTGYDLYLDEDQKKDDLKNKQQTISWFQKFNKREPSKQEKSDIAKFVNQHSLNQPKEKKSPSRKQQKKKNLDQNKNKNHKQLPNGNL